MAEEKAALIDSIYRKFVRGVSRAIGSDEFYEYFMTAIGNSHREFQFSNRRLIKSVDITWVEKIEGALSAMQNIISTPRNIIKEEELIVNVANAKKAGAETVRHLAVHSALVEDFNEDNGEVRPSRLMQRYREDSIGLYENRLVYTTMELAHHFVKIRHDALLEIISDEFGAKLKVRTDMDCATEHVHMDMFLHIKEIDGILETDAKHGDVLARISRIYRVITAYLGSDFAKEMAKLPRVSGTINKTNVLKKNPDYKVILQLWEFLKNYNDVGYSIRIEEQNPEISERFEENIYRNILFNYLILKGYLDDERDRKIPGNGRIKEKYIKPKVIQKIIEELTEDYDLTDVEVRKVLIEELTKEQLMKEEAAERLRLVEEQEGRRRAEEKALKAEQRLEKERLRKEREEEEARRREEKKQQAQEDRRRGEIFNTELGYFKSGLEEHIAERAAKEALWRRPQEDYEDAAAIMMEEELRRQALEYLKAYASELQYFAKNLEKRKKLRGQVEEEYSQEIEDRERLRRERLAKKTLENNL